MRWLSKSVTVCHISCSSDRVRQRVQIVAEVFCLGEKDKGLNDVSWNGDVVKGTGADEITLVSQQKSSAVRGKENQAVISSLCLSPTKDSLASLCHSKDISSWRRREWGEAALVSVRHRDRIITHPHPHRSHPDTQPPVDEKWSEEQRRALFYRLLLEMGGANMACIWKTRIWERPLHRPDT